MMEVKKRNGNYEEFNPDKIWSAIEKAHKALGYEMYTGLYQDIDDYISKTIKKLEEGKEITVEDIQDDVEDLLINNAPNPVVKAYMLYRERHKNVRDWADKKIQFIENYKKSDNTANATIDDNSNVSSKNIGILNAEIHKEDNIQINRKMVMNKLKELYPDFDNKQYVKDLEHHIIYKHDENSFSGAISPYCCSITMYPFLLHGIKQLGGLSAAPKNIDSFCGMYVNLIFAVASQFAGACATSEFLLFFTYFCKKEWGENFWQKSDTIISTSHSSRVKTIKSQIHQYWQQVIYSINQAAASRGMQSAFTNFSYFDKPFFEGMFGEFQFPDGSKPDWKSLNWIQQEFMQWFNAERLRTILTFPVESFCLLYRDGEFVDKESAQFVAEEYARGHSFFTYISDTVDSLSSCCRLKNKIQTHEFNFTNGNIGVQTGSKSVITLNLNRIIQDWWRENGLPEGMHYTAIEYLNKWNFYDCLRSILERVYKYHTAYNELLWDMYNANLLPVYKAGFIDLDKQYLTIGLNGLNEAAEFLGIECSDNIDYRLFCTSIFSTIKEENTKHKTKKTTYNTEQVPAESLAIKNYNWDKADNYIVPKSRNLYASYIFIPSDTDRSVLEKLKLHGREYIGDFLDGGASAHIGLDTHLSVEQYKKLLKYAADVGCQYFTFNVPNSECDRCGYITKVPIRICPKCGCDSITYYDRVIGFMTAIKNWSAGRQKEHTTRIFHKTIE